MSKKKNAPNFADITKLISQGFDDAGVGVKMVSMEDDPFYNRTLNISTGNHALNYLVSGDPFKGLLSGQILSLEGESYTGKSLTAAHLMKGAQDIGAVTILCDTEKGYTKPQLMKMGIDPNRVIMLKATNIEDLFSSARAMIMTLREKANDIPIFLLVDSISMLTSKHIEDTGMDKKDMARAAVLKQGYLLLNSVIDEMTFVIFVNHVYEDIALASLPNAKYIPQSQKQKVSGGKASIYTPGTRIRFGSTKKIYQNEKAKGDERGNVIGSWISAECLKNRFNMPYIKTDMVTLFDRGYTPYSGMFGLMLFLRSITKVGNGLFNFSTDPLPSPFKEGQFEDVLQSNPALMGKIVGTCLVDTTVDAKTLELGDDRGASMEEEDEAPIASAEELAKRLRANLGG